MKSITYLFMLIASIVCSTAYAGSTETALVIPVADVSGSLNGKSLLWYDELGNIYRFWFRVSGMTESDPTQTGETGIPCDISPNATVGDIAYAMQYPILNPLPNQFTERFGLSAFASEEDPLGPPYAAALYTLYEGDVQDITDVDTGFTLSVYEQGGN